MKIKHFHGYGSVDAKKVSKKKVKDIFLGELTELVIKVSGNHERGLVRNDTYDLFNWLVKRFDKTITDYRQIRLYNCNESFEDGVDTCVYTFYY